MLTVELLDSLEEGLRHPTLGSINRLIEVGPSLIEVARQSLTRPPVHRARLTDDGWSMAHPIWCDPLDCSFNRAVAENAAEMYEDHGAHGELTFDIYLADGDYCWMLNAAD